MFLLVTRNDLREKNYLREKYLWEKIFTRKNAYRDQAYTGLFNFEPFLTCKNPKFSVIFL